VLLPGHGPILELLGDAGVHTDTINTRHLWVLRKADIARAMTLGLPRNLRALAQAMRDLKAHDLTYVNTAVILDFLLASLVTRRAIIVHVREIPTGMALKIIRMLLRCAKAQVIFNSYATRDAFALPDSQRQAVIYNGAYGPDEAPQRVDITGRPLNILCIGRLNAWKGQEVLIEACALLDPEMRAKLSVRIVGGVYKTQTHFRDTLIDRIAQHGLEQTIQMIDFVDNPESEYATADVVVVPSTLPEPFGRVAIEAMAQGAAVIASNHGGLREIVVDAETGALIAPGDAGALARALEAYLQKSQMAAEQGAAGRTRFLDEFTQEICDTRLVAALN